ncbi:ISAs1 family transposase [Vibrio lentus]|nr:ISAs1 family transposase [Vibrio lentus]MDH5929482.1 ISAs1 family transposase [Vibrio lentus]
MKKEVSSSVDMYYSDNKWESIQTVICVESERHIGDKVTTENWYYISSLNVDAQKLNRIIRQHWEVESMHWTLDMTFNEDASWIRRGNAAEVDKCTKKSCTQRR